jgi:hypothetical protein
LSKPPAPPELPFLTLRLDLPVVESGSITLDILLLKS